MRYLLSSPLLLFHFVYFIFFHFISFTFYYFYFIELYYFVDFISLTHDLTVYLFVDRYSFRRLPSSFLLPLFHYLLLLSLFHLFFFSPFTSICTGVLGAPFPFIVGIHSSFLLCPDCVLPAEGTVVDLDRNKISYGNFGLPPPLPDRRCRKLLQLISSYAPVFDRRGEDWSESRLPLFDSAFTAVTDTAAMESGKNPPLSKDNIIRQQFKHVKDSAEINEAAIRAGFLNFFVAVLKYYRG